MMRRILVLFCIVVSLMGCANLGTYNPATGRRDFIVIPVQDEVAMGQELHQQILKQYHLSADTAKTKRIEDIGRRVSLFSDRQDYGYHFYLIEKDDLNAFTIPGGKIYIFTGLADKLKSDDEIAGVLGHEIGHCAARHTIKKFQAAMGYNLIGSIVFSRMADKTMKDITSLGTNAVMDLVFKAYGRQDEYQADRLALKYMHLAGYAPEGMLNVLEVLKAASKGDRVPTILRTHPLTDDRITAIKKELEQYY